MSKQVLALSLRPTNLDDLVGQEKLVRQIRGHYVQRMPNAWMFIGETGSGKTTIARILATSLQCKHQNKFGCPCANCIRKRSSFDATEINASDFTGIDELREAVSGADYFPRPGSRYRVYILDEAQMLSKSSQNLLLKYFEDCPKTTVWFICTTHPEKILATLQRRCLIYTVPSLDLKGVRILVKRALKHIESDKSVSDLVDQLNEKLITSPGLIMNAVEKYVAGAKAEDAVMVNVAIFDAGNICSALRKGDWGDVAKQLRDFKPEEVRRLRSSVAAYLRAILLDEVDYSSRTKIVANGIKELASLASMDDSLQLSATSAVLYNMCRDFRKYGH